ALDRLGLTVRGMQDLGIAVPGDANSRARLDQQADVLQLAWIALSLLLGRRMSPGEYPRRIGPLLDDFADASHGGSPALVSAIRGWLERALFAGNVGFSSAIEAQAELGDLQSHSGRHAIAFAAGTTNVEQLAFASPQQLPPANPIRSESGQPEIAFRAAEDVSNSASEVPNMPKPLKLVTEAVDAEKPATIPARTPSAPRPKRWGAGWAVAAVLALIAATEAIVLARTGLMRAGPAVTPEPPVPIVID